MNKFAEFDLRYVWHPFTQMRDWLKREPIVIHSGTGATLVDVTGKEYLDANSSIWTNLHGHCHPRINRAIQKQLEKIAHSSALGLANEPSSILAKQLIDSANLPDIPPKKAVLERVFYSDDGSTAIEVALKMAFEYARRTKKVKNPRFLTLSGAYHGDTVGAVSLGHINLFHRAYSQLLFKTDAVMAPYCYRCPFNRAQPEKADARTYRKCHWECIDKVSQSFERQRKRGASYAAMVIEPLIQGAAGMIPQPDGWLYKVDQIVHEYEALLIADEVMTGFGRTGIVKEDIKGTCLFACQHAGIRPDIMALSKGLTGGYLPLAATLTNAAVFEAFLGEYHEFKTFFHGHSYTANQLGCASALASLDILETPKNIKARQNLEKWMDLSSFWDFECVGDIRKVGLIAGIELVKDRSKRTPFALEEKVGMRVGEAMARRGVLTRPIGNIIVIMPPYCTTQAQMKKIISVLYESIEECVATAPGK